MSLAVVVGFVLSLDHVRRVLHRFCAPRGVGVLTAAKLTARDRRCPTVPVDGQARTCCWRRTDPAPRDTQRRHRLDRGDYRQLDAAMHRIAITQLVRHQPARDYVAPEVAEAKTLTPRPPLVRRFASGFRARSSRSRRRPRSVGGSWRHPPLQRIARIGPLRRPRHHRPPIRQPPRTGPTLPPRTTSAALGPP
jgi:hypothetical protein